jgi:hydroxyethylthiazole kinase-like uncharacterized protein yjeF
VKIVSVAQMRALEAAAFAAGISEAALQERAGHAVAEEIFKLVQPGDRVVVLVGHGNNGRDGAVAAEWLGRHNVVVDVVLAPRHAVTPTELLKLRGQGASVIAAEDQVSVAHTLRNARVAVDALVGIGATGALREPLASLAQQINAARATCHVVALDLPSGVDADTGDVPGEAVSAHTTVTLGCVKQGLLRFPAAARVGRLIPRDIGIPAAAKANLAYGCLTAEDLCRLVPPRPLDAHKYRFGRTLVVAGSDHFLGAAVLSSGGAARIGSGLVTVASTRDVRLTVAAHVPEVTFTTQDVRVSDGTSAAETIQPYLKSHNSVVLGPGLGRGQSITTFVEQILKTRPREHHLVLDADGLVALSEIPEWWKLTDANVVLTPHSGELERLLGHELESEKPMWVHAGELAQKWGCVLIAKGPFTCVAAPDGKVDVWPWANPALATGGTGDVLAGITAGLLAQSVSTWDAARLAVAVHAITAERIVASRRWRTLLASDLLEELPATLAALRPAE